MLNLAVIPVTLSLAGGFSTLPVPPGGGDTLDLKTEKNYVYIQNWETKACLDAVTSSFGVNNLAGTFSCSHLPQKRFLIRSLDSGIQIASVQTRLCLSAPVAASPRVALQRCTDAAEQKWKLINPVVGGYTFVNEKTNLCIQSEPLKPEPSDLSVIIGAACNKSGAQQFTFTLPTPGNP